MRTLRKIPSRLPTYPVLVREAYRYYAIWTGRNWFGHVMGVHRFWHVETPSTPRETFETKAAAIAEAEHRALRAEGK